MTFYGSLLPVTFFQEWCFVLFCFLLTRKFLTWDLLLGLGKQRTLWWILRGTFVASHLHLCFILSCLDFFQPSVTMRLCRSIGPLIDLFLYFFALCVCFLKPCLNLKGPPFLLIIFSSFYREEEQKGILSTVRFHVLNQISGSQSYSPCRAQFTVSPGAWGRGPSRKRLILLALSLLREINALRNIWRMPCVPRVNGQTHLPGGLRALK